jgi:succinate dehydrogenase / fumarate reductase cytochrome b subunit
VLFGYTWALMHHMLGGLRHFMWDMGRGYEKHFNTKLAIVTPFVSVALTVLVWIIGYLAR